ncbi:hypothetical protein AB0N87_41940 [Streptomyces sp. NPDC093228]|uniref:hypothetical protein n=1 Tax=Streptomyces sp. NPDC093228 TaxID=3155070 RepID=UPI00342A93A4
MSSASGAEQAGSPDSAPSPGHSGAIKESVTVRLARFPGARGTRAALFGSSRRVRRVGGARRGGGRADNVWVEALESTAQVRARMSRQKSRDTQVELALRRALHAAGLRFRVHRRPVKGVRREADIVFGPARVAVFVGPLPDYFKLSQSISGSSLKSIMGGLS